MKKPADDDFCLHCAVLELIKQHRGKLDSKEVVFRLAEVIGAVIEHAPDDEAKVGLLSYAISCVVEHAGGEAVVVDEGKISEGKRKH